jgi:hypothetical protein
LEPLRFGSVITVLVMDEDVEEVKVVVADLPRTHAELIANALTHEERKRHIEEGLCFTYHKKGHRLF